MFGRSSRIIPRYLFLLSLIFIFTFPLTSIYGWSNHTAMSYVILNNMPEFSEKSSVKQNKVIVETLETFLQKEKKNLAVFFKDLQKYLQKNHPHYPKLPSKLAWTTNKDLKTAFLNRLRINPNIRLGYYLQDLPGHNIQIGNDYSYKKITIFKDISWLKSYTYKSIKPGQRVKATDVLATASDEPDYGLDIGLYENSNTLFGKLYGFGVQPFGNPKYEFSGQAPFHMGFYNESFLMYLAAPFLNQTYPDMRAIMYLKLAQFAFKHKHKYWGYRFLGWGLHYIQDLTQPYHAKVMPGYGTFHTIFINILSLIGFKSPLKAAIERVSDRHMAIETYQYILFKDILANNSMNHPLIKALLAKDQNIKVDIPFIRKTISKRAYDKAEDFDEAIGNWPSIMNLTKDKNIKLIKIDNKVIACNKELMDRMIDFGKYSRAYIRTALQP